MDYTEHFRDKAIYTPSVHPEYARLVANDPATVRGGTMPDGLSLADLNFLDPRSRLFHIDHVLYSAGQALKGRTRKTMIGRRGELPKAVTVIGDSGGYQLITGAMAWQGDTTRELVLQWLEEYCDVAMTLDVPTRAIDDQRSIFTTFEECLSTTLQSLAYFERNRRPGRVRFLNVLQGRTRKELETWYEAVRRHQFEGWAFAGKLKHDFCEVLRLLVRIRDDDQLEDKDWIHFLGTAKLEVACVLTMIQQALRENGFPDLVITYDTSTPFSMPGQSRRGFRFPSFTKDSWSTPVARMPDDRRYVGCSRPFPYPSALGDRLKMGDICVRDEAFQDTTWDGLSSHLIANHNLDVLLRAICQGHRLCALEQRDAEVLTPGWLLEAKWRIAEVFRREKPMTLISQSRPFLRALVQTDDVSDDPQLER